MSHGAIIKSHKLSYSCSHIS